MLIGDLAQVALKRHRRQMRNWDANANGAALSVRQGHPCRVIAIVRPSPVGSQERHHGIMQLCPRRASQPPSGTLTALSMWLSRSQSEVAAGVGSET